jgi:hypothetical protein
MRLIRVTLFKRLPSGTHLSIDGQCSRVRVVNRVAGLVVAGVLLNARASMKTTNGLPDVHEALVITSSREPRGCDIDTVLLEVLNKELLDSGRARRAGQVVRAAVAIKDTKVSARYHVEVQVCENIVRVGRVQVLSIPLRAK